MFHVTRSVRTNLIARFKNVCSDKIVQNEFPSGLRFDPNITTRVLDFGCRYIRLRLLTIFSSRTDFILLRRDVVIMAILFTINLNYDLIWQYIYLARMTIMTQRSAAWCFCLITNNYYCTLIMSIVENWCFWLSENFLRLTRHTSRHVQGDIWCGFYNCFTIKTAILIGLEIVKLGT